MNKEELFSFCEEWLSSWTGNQPAKLLSYYTSDALYVDPANKEGLEGHKEILPYFERLLRVYHDWAWKPLEVFPTEKGAIVKWRCEIRVGKETIDEIGLDIVEFEGRKISRNEVYFDRTRLMAAVERKKQIERLHY